jgi:hypothetical protein
MADARATSPVLSALLNELSAQGQEGIPSPDGRQLTAFPIKGTLDLVALAEAVENALGADTSEEEEAKTPAELNAANDG